MPPTHIVYILRCAEGSLYVGKTEHLGERLRRHNEGTACAFTRTRLPISLAWSERHSSLDSADARERQIKRWTRAKKEALISGDLSRLRELSRSRSTRNGRQGKAS